MAEAPFACSVCGAHVPHTRYLGGIGEKMAEGQVCFSCNFWQDKIEHADKYIRINGNCYHAGPESPQTPSSMRGFDGRRFIILMDDGTRIETTNLWYQGVIPEHFQDELPDNAHFEHS